MTPELRRAPSDGKCPKCGANEWQLVEQMQQWHLGRFVLGKGFVFEGNHEWAQVSEEGDPLLLECRSCFTPYGIPEFDWA